MKTKTSKQVSKFASMLGKLGKGIPKTLTAEERARRAEQMKKNRRTVVKAAATVNDSVETIEPLPAA